MILYYFMSVIFLAQGFPSLRTNDEDWGYVNIRENAHTFWWLYGAENIEQRSNLPLVLWLQGGPGASGTGFGNFMEIGPIDSNLKPRNTTWIKKANILFVDNPVGTGFSYTTTDDALTTNVTQIADDLYVFMKVFLENKPAFQANPFFIACESYGGKMTPAFGVRLLEGIANKDITLNFKGVALGDSWVSGVDSVISWGPYLYQYNLLDDNGLEQVMEISQKTVNAVNEGKYLIATQLWSQTEDLIFKLTDGVNVYNVLQHNVPQALTKSFSLNLYENHVGVFYEESLVNFMNSEVRKKLGIIPDSVVWGSQANKVFQRQSEDFMKPVIKYVDQLISAGIKVTVYQGQLDMICDTPGAELWIKKLQWPYLNDFLVAPRKPLYVKSKGQYHTQAFLKSFKNFSLYYIMNAGHMVPSDNGEMALEMIGQIISEE